MVKISFGVIYLTPSKEFHYRVNKYFMEQQIGSFKDYKFEITPSELKTS